MFELLLYSVCSGATLVTGEMSAFYIFVKTSVTCVGTLREEEALLLKKFTFNWSCRLTVYGLQRY